MQIFTTITTVIADWQSTQNPLQIITILELQQSSLSIFTGHSALLAGSDQEQDSQGSRGKFNRVVEFHPPNRWSIYPPDISRFQQWIYPIIPRIKRRSAKSSTNLESRSKKSTLEEMCLNEWLPSPVELV